MNPVVVANAVVERLKVDSALYDSGAWKDVLKGGVHAFRGLANPLVFPFGVVTIATDMENAFQGMGANVTITLALYDEEGQGVSRLSTLCDHIIGDAMLASGTRTTPTFGLHNHFLALGSNTLGATGSQLNMTASDLSPENERVTRMTLTFTGITSNTAVNQ